MPKVSKAAALKQATPAPSSVRQQVAQDVEGEQGKQPKTDRESFAGAFDSHKVGGNIPNGKYEARLEEAVLQDFDEEKGQSVRWKFRIATGAAVGEEATFWNKLFNKDGTTSGGLNIFKQNMAKIGMEGVQFKDLEEEFKKLTEEHGGYTVEVKHKDGFLNVYILGIIEGGSPALEQLNELHPF